MLEFSKLIKYKSRPNCVKPTGNTIIKMVEESLTVILTNIENRTIIASKKASSALKKVMMNCEALDIVLLYKVILS